MLNIFGHRSAFLEDVRSPFRPQPPLADRDQLETSYDEYCQLYDQFFQLATSFNAQTIPLTRLVIDDNGATHEEYTIPKYCGVNPDDPDDAIAVNELENNIQKEQAIYLERWTQLKQLISDLSQHEYVHRRGGKTRTIVSYVDEHGITLRDVDVTNMSYPTRRVIGEPLYIHDHQVTQHYEAMLYAVVYQK